MAAKTQPGILTRLSNALRGTVAGFRAFDAGKWGRRLQAIPSTQVSINTLIRTYGRTVLARSRYLSANNPYTMSAREAFKAALAGYGIKPSALGETPEDKEAIQNLWLDWTEYADIEGQQDFYGLQDSIAGEIFDAGEVFVEMIEENYDPSSDVPPLKLRLIPAEMLPYENNYPKVSADGSYISMGIEFSADGRRIAYHFLKENPGEMLTSTGTYETVRIPAERVLHIFRPIRVGQIRGVPYTLASMTTLAMLDLYDDAELERKRMSALFAAFVTRPDIDDDGDHPLGTPDVDPATGETAFNMQPGSVVDLAPGEEVTFSTPPTTDAGYEMFQYRMLMRAAAGFGVPYASMTGDLRKANYGSIRAGLVEFKRRITPLQWNTMIHQLCRPVWKRFLDLAALYGLTPWSRVEYMANRRLHRRVKWIPPKWEWVDPQKDLMAEKIAVDNGFKSRSDVIEEQGYDAEETDRRILADRKRERELSEKIDGQPLFSREAIDESNMVKDAAPDPQTVEVDVDG
jgi:lambda family phage portal protein